MATIPQHFERLCVALEVAEQIEDREAQAEYLRSVAASIRQSPRNTHLRLWFLKSSLEILGVEAELDEAVA